MLSGYGPTRQCPSCLDANRKTSDKERAELQTLHQRQGLVANSLPPLALTYAQKAQRLSDARDYVNKVEHVVGLDFRLVVA